nr:diguanylate cyclase [Raoultella sp. NCTC 9187]
MGRLGGEEFAVLFLAPTAQDVASYAARIQHEIRKLTFHTSGGETFKVTASSGFLRAGSARWRSCCRGQIANCIRRKNSGRDRICGLP